MMMSHPEHMQSRAGGGGKVCKHTDISWTLSLPPPAEGPELAITSYLRLSGERQIVMIDNNKIILLYEAGQRICFHPLHKAKNAGWLSSWLAGMDNGYIPTQLTGTT